MNSVQDFNSELLASLRSGHAETEVPVADLAFDPLCGTLEREGEIEAIERMEFTGSSSGKTLRIDGTAGDPMDADGVLSVIVLEMFDGDEPATINAADAKRLFSHLMNFVTASLKREFRDSLHPDMPTTGTASLIASAWRFVTKIKLILAPWPMSRVRRRSTVLSATERSSTSSKMAMPAPCGCSSTI